MASGAGLLVAGVPLAWVGPWAFLFLLLLLPVLGGWSPPGAVGLASSAGAAPSNFRFLRFLVSGKKPFFFLFALRGLCVTLGTSLASFFSDLGRLGDRAQKKGVPSERCGPPHSAPCPRESPGPPRTYWTPRAFIACQ